MEQNRKRILWITRTAIFIALLVVIQVATKLIAMPTLVTGSFVNLLLVMSVMTCGLSSGITVAVLSPVLAMLAGIGPHWALIPFIALGNLVLVLIWHFIGVRAFRNRLPGNIVALAVGAGLKFLVLYFTIVRLMLPLFLKLPAKQAGVITATFSLPQLFTALMGGTVALLALPVIRRALSSREG
jgi:hypothetical protein